MQMRASPASEVGVCTSGRDGGDSVGLPYIAGAGMEIRAGKPPQDPPSREPDSGLDRVNACAASKEWSCREPVS